MSKPVKILRASAGSGKTFRLARTYIEQTVRSDANAPGPVDPSAFRHILAVTFTNKATDEMKHRILQELFCLAVNTEKSGYYTYFTGIGAGTDEPVASPLIKPYDLQKRASNALRALLHDYSAFAVSTIDKFFQQTLRAFAKEIGQFADYQVELDSQSLVQESVDRILDSLTDDTPESRARLEWFTEAVREKLNAGERTNIDEVLYSMADRLQKDEHRTLVEQHNIDERKSYSTKQLVSLRKTCDTIIGTFNAEVAGYAKEMADGLRAYQLGPKDAKGGATRSFLNRFVGADMAGGLIVYADERNKRARIPTPKLTEWWGDHDAWVPAKSKRILGDLQSAIELPFGKLAAMFESSNGVYSKAFKVYNTACELRGQVCALGITSDLYDCLQALMKEKNVMTIDRSNTALKDIIDGSDAPFVYEKLGVRYEHFLLDEFQDTSVIQWENFLPLLAESASNGNESLVVGDVKQSIYRWRGSDWNLLDSRVKADLDARVPESVDDSESLQDNWRSLANVVHFNNGFFSFAAARLDSLFNSKFPGNAGKISKIYSDVRQNVRKSPEKSGQGMVKCEFCDNEEIADSVVAAVKNAVARGFAYKDIAVLTRSNKIGSDIANVLIANDIPVVSDESLKVKGSVTVRRLAALLSYANNPDDKVNAYLAREVFDAGGNVDALDLLSRYHSLTDLGEEFLRRIRARENELGNGNLSESEGVYIQAFMDNLSDWTSTNGNNLAVFLDYWNSADPSIASPKDINAVRILTIHKSKGLEFPYVIFPFADKVTLSRSENHWVKPEVEGSPLEQVADGVYDVSLRDGSDATLYAADYQEEVFKQYVDNINIFYVALTRAGKALHIISDLPSKKFTDACSTGTEVDAAGSVPVYEFSNFSQMLYWYVSKASFLHGQGEDALVFTREDILPEVAESDKAVVTMQDGTESPENGVSAATADDAKSAENEASAVASDNVKEHYAFTTPDEDKAFIFREKQSEEQESEWLMAYPSVPIGDRLRLSLSTERTKPDEGNDGAPDFFMATYSGSKRYRGSVLHGILEKVNSTDDLQKAVGNALAAGEIDACEAEDAMSLLERKIAERRNDPATEYWFKPSAASGAGSEGWTFNNEFGILDTDGSEKRPDRVAIKDGHVRIVDYKFAQNSSGNRARYHRQVNGYVDLYRQMGFEDVKGWLWYISFDSDKPDEIVEV